VIRARGDGVDVIGELLRVDLPQTAELDEAAVNHRVAAIARRLPIARPRKHERRSLGASGSRTEIR
jgi:hypothetical protein